MKPRVLVTGSSGLVGSRFIELFKHKYVFSTPDYPAFDITDFSKTQKSIKEIHPDIVVNFAAYTNVGEAEGQRNDKNGNCWKINVTGVKNLLRALPRNCRFIQISTDMVFPGTSEDKGPYSENHKLVADPSKLTWYGFTKGEGEREVVEKLGKKAAILRLAYPFRAKYEAKIDHVRRILMLYKEGKLYPMFEDQQFTITFIDKIAVALGAIIDRRRVGIFHASSEDTTTPFDVASYVVNKVGGVKDVVKGISVDEFIKKTGDNQTRYPKYGGLKVKITEKKLGIRFGTWRQMVDEFVRQL